MALSMGEWEELELDAPRCGAP